LTFLVDTNVFIYVAEQSGPNMPLSRVRPGLAGEAGALVYHLAFEHGVHRVVTRDADFHRFPFLEVTDPLNP